MPASDLETFPANEAPRQCLVCTERDEVGSPYTKQTGQRLVVDGLWQVSMGVEGGEVTDQERLLLFCTVASWLFGVGVGYVLCRIRMANNGLRWPEKQP